MENAYDYYRQALHVSTDIEPPHPRSPFDSRPLPLPDDTDKRLMARFMKVRAPDEYTPEQMREMLERNTASLALLRLGLEYPCTLPEYRIDDLIAFGAIIQMGPLSKLFLLESWARAADGDLPGAFRSAADTVRFGISLGNRCVTVRFLGAAVIQRNGLAQVARLCGKLDAYSARQAAAQMATIAKARKPFASIAEDELSFQENWLRERLARGNLADEVFEEAEDGLLSPRKRKEHLEWLSSRSDTEIMQQFREYRDEMMRQSSLPFSASPLPDNPVTENQGTLFATHLRWNHIAAQHAFVICALALRAHLCEYGHYPDSLRPLVPGILPAVPLDPFTGGDEVRYRLPGDAYVLYSVGPDGKDNKGRPIKGDLKPSSKGDIIFETPPDWSPLAVATPPEPAFAVPTAFHMSSPTPGAPPGPAGPLPWMPAPPPPLRRDAALKQESAAQEADDNLRDEVMGRILSGVRYPTPECPDADVVHLQSLSPDKRMLYAIFQLEGEVYNGGFQQYYCNTGGKLAEEALSGYVAIGARSYARLLRRVLIVVAREKKRRVELSGAQNPHVMPDSFDMVKLLPFDGEFYDLQNREPSDQFKVRYIREHPEDFAD